MSPSTYYCWLAGRLYSLAWQRRRLPPAHQPLPAAFLFVVPAVTIFVVGGLLWLTIGTALFLDGMRWTSLGDLNLGFANNVWFSLARLLGAVGGVTALISWLVWNQRAARIRNLGVTDAPAIPAPHAGLRWTLGLAYFAVFSLLTPLLLLGFFENLAGAYAWRTTRNSLIAKGERLTTEAIIPPYIAGDQNAANWRLLRDLFPDNGPNDSGSLSNAMAKFNVFLLPYYALPPRTLPNGHTDPSPIPLKEWANSFRIATGVLTNRVHRVLVSDLLADEVLAKRYGLKVEPSTNRPKVIDETLRKPNDIPAYPAAAAGSDDVTVLLKGLSIAEPEFQELSEALRRPYARFPIRWYDGFGAMLPHLAKLKSMQQWIELHVRTRLAAGDIDGAFADAKTAVRLAEMVREEPLIISQLVRIALNSIAARTIDHGVLSHQWTEAQLREFQEIFSRMTLIGDMGTAFEGERAIAISTVDKWISDPQKGAEVLPDSEAFPIRPLIEKHRIPGVNGFIRYNQVSLATYYSLLIRYAKQVETKGAASGFLAEVSAMTEATDGALKSMSKGQDPRTLLTRMLAPAVSKALVKAVRAEQRARLTSVACAIERFRIKHGGYPSSLSELVPEYVASEPLDLLDHKPLRYRKEVNGTFTLWSVGINGVDDGGILHAQKKDDGEVLDWVWPY